MENVRSCAVCGKPVDSDTSHGLCPACLMKSGFETKSGDNPAEAAAPVTPPPMSEVAKLFPQLEIIELLGSGGMGAVYKARQPRLNRLVALKILPPEKQNNPQFAERFEREARALAALTHPNIVTIYDFGEVQGNFYLLMEFVDGVTLRQFYSIRRLASPEALGIIGKICDALQYAHDRGIVHRDIKPENILLDKNAGVKIADFGIAKVLDPVPGNVSLTGHSDVVGTVHYMAPEQLEKPQQVDARADLYSLGVVFYEMLTGELPLGKFEAPSRKVQVDVRLDHVVLHALEKEPERRYQTATQVKTDVEAIASTPQSAPSPAASAVPPVIKTAKDNNKVAAIIGCVALAFVLLFVGVAALFLGMSHKSPATTVTATITAPPTPVASVKTNSNIDDSLLNDQQRQVLDYCERKFQPDLDSRTFATWSSEDRAGLELRSIDIIKGPRSEEVYQSINTLAALRSTNALPVLRKLAFDHRETIVRLESSNRPRWMAVRAMGLIGDRESVPRLIHVLYHNNSYVRWWAQITLVRLTGQNFGNDWKAWGYWWNAQNQQPPFEPEMVHWYRHQPEPEQLAKDLATADESFFETIKGKKSKTALPSN